jgi:hypothetical protein
MARLPHDFPPVVYAPTVTLTGDDGQTRLELLETNDGRLALFVYSALDRLHSYYAPDKPWALLTVDNLQQAYEDCPYDLLFLDKRPRQLTANEVEDQEVQR